MANGPEADDIAAVSAEIDAILSSEQFHRSPALADLLAYLGGRFAGKAADPTSEYAIAQDLLNRGAEFDPKADTAVRVRIRRLREALAAYYDDGTGPVALSIPGRSYDLELVRRGEAVPPPQPPSQPPPSGRRSVARILRSRPGLLSLAAVALLAVATAFLIADRPVAPSYPLIKILPVQNLSGNPGLDIFEAGLQRQLGTDLQKFGRYRVFIASPPKRNVTGADFTLRSSILRLDDQIDLAFRLERGPDNGLVYGGRIHGRILGQSYYDAIAAISRKISGRIAGQGGPLTRDAPQPAAPGASLLGGGSARGVGAEVFRCIVLKDRFFDDYDPRRFVAAYRCFEEVLPRIHSDPVALSSWGTLVLHAVPQFDLMQTDDLPPDIAWTPEAALELARRIVATYPNAAEAYLLLGAVQSAMGSARKAEISLHQSITLNPGDATAYAVMSYLQMSEDHFDRSIAFAEEAIRLSAEPQGYIYLPITISQLVLGNKRAAIDAGNAYAAKLSGPGAVVIRLIVARLTNDQSAIDRLSPEVAGMTNPFSGYASFLRGERTRKALRSVLPEVDLAKRLR